MINKCAPVAQLDRASASGVEGRGFKSRRVHHFFAFFIGDCLEKFGENSFEMLFQTCNYFSKCYIPHIDKDCIFSVLDFETVFL